MPGNMHLENLALRSEMRRYFITSRELCKFVGIHEITLCKWLARPLTPDKEQRIRTAIDQIIKQRLEVSAR